MSTQEQDVAITVMTGLPWALATAEWRGADATGAVRMAVNALHYNNGSLLEIGRAHV